MEMSEDHTVALAPDRPRRSEPIALATLATEIGARVIGNAEGVEVTGFTLSSQRAFPGDLYAALPGSRSHGIFFAPAAVDAASRCSADSAPGAARPALTRRRRSRW